MPIMAFPNLPEFCHNFGCFGTVAELWRLERILPYCFYKSLEAAKQSEAFTSLALWGRVVPDERSEDGVGAIK